MKHVSTCQVMHSSQCTIHNFMCDFKVKPIIKLKLKIYEAYCPNAHLLDILMQLDYRTIYQIAYNINVILTTTA